LPGTGNGFDDDDVDVDVYDVADDVVDDDTCY
jgi:hypothetical protein